ncbi:MAG: hypothetical protein Q8Q46_00935 [Candidatus Giovannonibacteria bacterium]|nr:hypothetical protein [Candidatus Giovannonibacteria bacterium]
MTVSTIICNIVVVIKQLTSLLFIVATLVFLWGVIQYVIAGEDEKKVGQGRKYITYGLFGLFVMLAMWGLVFAIYRTVFGTSPSLLPFTSSCPSQNLTPILTPS